MHRFRISKYIVQCLLFLWNCILIRFGCTLNGKLGTSHCWTYNLKSKFKPNLSAENRKFILIFDIQRNNFWFEYKYLDWGLILNHLTLICYKSLYIILCMQNTYKTVYLMTKVMPPCVNLIINDGHMFLLKKRVMNNCLIYIITPFKVRI